MNIRPLTLNARPVALQWVALIGATLALVALFRLAGLPAALLLGAIAGAILVASFEGRVTIPPRSFLLAQALIGCLIAKAIGAASMGTMLKQWPIFLIGIGAVIAFAAGLGLLLARWKVLPGTTAIWGSSPGAATAMVLMAEAFGADIRLVAVMQYLRVAFVGLIASIVAREWAVPGAVSPVPADWFPALAPVPLLATLVIAVGGAVIGVKAKIPAGPLLVTLVIATILEAAHVVTITLPPWLLAACYAAVGWSIGFRFTRPMVAYAARQLPRIVASIVALIVLCGGLAYALHIVVGTDPLTAYLATSPGGADSVAIIAASSKVDLPFVMTMQIGRAVVAILIGPALARFLVRWAVET
jgi:membrane AbrB-like protein